MFVLVTRVKMMMMQETRGFITSLFTKSEERDELPGASSDHQKGMRQVYNKEKAGNKTWCKEPDV